MASLFFIPGNGAGTFQELVFDLLLSQSHALDADVTAYPVEQGVQPSDHIQPKAEPIQLEALFSDYVVGESDSSPGRAKDKLATLLNLRDTGTLVDLVTPSRQVKNCALAHVSFALGDDTNSIHVSLGLQQVVVVQTRTAKILRKKVSDPSVKPMANEGAKASSATEAPADSWGWSLFGPDGALVTTPAPGTPDDPLARLFH